MTGLEKAPARAAAYVAVLGVVLVAALGVGRLVGPVDLDAAPAHASDDEHAGDDHAAPAASVSTAGLAQEVDGYRLELPGTRLGSGVQPFTFTVVGPEGEPVTAYDEAHERDLHLIAVRRDLTGFQHVHPTLDPATGEWSTELALEPGSWRVLADFVPSGGEQVVLGADLVAEGDGGSVPLGEDVLSASVDGYEVIVETAPAVGEETAVVATVRRDGRPVTDLGQYLGELGHLVVLRDGDLAYVHGHPDAGAGTGPEIPFTATFPTGGRYRLFLEFEHAGAVHTAEFTVSVEAGDGHTHSHGDEDGAGGGH
ncbi:hypothetical protein [Nocardioides sp.]|uniref:hypothetical protein n=1 Tax=Nocardioides sp. TaxID=35761 RepID=UPI001A1FFC2A|nr:hypothetical protein [Nocardioides sp.]MBJ7358080.1 hypothetical protein [Nocardioides sp.]